MFGLEEADPVKQVNMVEFFVESERDRAQNEIIPDLVHQGNLVSRRLEETSRPKCISRWSVGAFVIPDAKTGEPSFIVVVGAGHHGAQKD